MKPWYNWIWLTVSSGRCVLVCPTWRSNESVFVPLAWSTQCPHGIIVDPESEKEISEGCRNRDIFSRSMSYLLLYSCSVFSTCLPTWQCCWDGSEREVVITLEWQCCDISEAQGLLGSLHFPHTTWMIAYFHCVWNVLQACVSYVHNIHRK